MINASHGVKIFSVAATLGLLATGCSAPKFEPKTLTPTVVPVPSEEEPEIKSLRDADLGNTTWIDPMSFSDEENKIKLVDSKATDEFNSYKLGKIVYADLNGDGVEDAVAPFESTSGNAYWEHYVPWIATEDGPVQVLDEIGYSHNCGSNVDSVVPAKQGVIVTEYLRSEFQNTACAENGPLKQVRTVAVEQSDGDEQYHLVRQDSHGGYGGYCHPEPDGVTIAVQLPIYAAPHEKSEIPVKPGMMLGYVSGPKEMARLSEDEQWVLASALIRDEKTEGGMTNVCAWLPTIENPLYSEGEPVVNEHGKLAG